MTIVREAAGSRDGCVENVPEVVLLKKSPKKACSRNKPRSCAKFTGETKLGIVGSTGKLLKNSFSFRSRIVKRIYKQHIRPSDNKGLQCDEHREDFESCKFATEVLKYFEDDLQKLGRRRIVNIAPEVQVCPIYEVWMDSSMDAARFLVLGVGTRIHILNRLL